MYFRIIIPNYNNAFWLPNCLDSIARQTFDDYVAVLVDDMSTDDSLKIGTPLMPLMTVRLTEKAYNGGARNRGLVASEEFGAKYTLFLDSDDWFYDDDVLQVIHDRLEETHPDCLTLPYKWQSGKMTHSQGLVRNDRKTLVDSILVACWTKCVRSELVVPFPENTLMEDVVQHIAQADVCETFDSLDRPVVLWNRNNTKSITRSENQNLREGKWRSSMFRYAADLMDLELKTEECKAHRDWRLQVIVNDIKKGKFI